MEGGSGGSSSSKVMMGATIVMVALVLLALLLLYCSLFLRRRASTSTATTYGQQPPLLQPNAAPSLCSFYAQGVVRAPRSCLFPAPENQLELEKQLYSFCPPPAEASPAATSSSGEQLMMYICNPMYNHDEAKEEDTPADASTSPDETPPLTPMKHHPPDSPSISLTDARSVYTTGTDSNGGISSYSSNTSPSS